MHKHSAAEMGKSGKIRNTEPKTGLMGVPEELWFFPGHVAKNRDCPGKSGTDGHLKLTSPADCLPTKPEISASP